MLTRFHKILIAALAIQLVLVVVVLTRSDDNVALKEHPVIAGFDAAKVTRLQVFAGQAPAPIDLVKRDAGWVLASAFDYPVDTTKVNDVLSPIAKATAAAPIATQAARHKQLHVADGDFERKLVVTLNGKDLTLYLGAPAGTRRSALRIGGSDDVFGISGISAAAFGAEPSAWVDPAYVKVKRDEVSKVVVQRDGTTVELVRAAAPVAAGSASGSAATPPAAASWTATIGGAPIALAAGETFDQAAIDRLVSLATAIDLTAPADPKRDAAKPTATITIEHKAIGATTPAQTVVDAIADGATYWVHDRSSPRAVLVDKARLDDVVGATRDKLVKKPAPPATQSATPPSAPGGFTPPPGMVRPGTGSASGPG